MRDDLLSELLARNDDHHQSLTLDLFKAVRDGQKPPVVSVSCSDSRVAHEGMWNVTEPGWLFTATNIGNQVRTTIDGDAVISGSITYPIHHTETTAIAVVGHTGCGAVTAAYDAVTKDEYPTDPGIAHDIDGLIPIVKSGLEAGLADEVDRETTINRLVEYNVLEQVSFLLDADSIPDHVDVYGFVYDIHGAYGAVDGRAYIVSVNGDRDPAAIERAVDDQYVSHVKSLL